MVRKFRSRKGKLELGLEEELSNKIPKLENILILVDDYEKDNLDTIDKLKRGKSLELKKINGALKQTIDAHGPITKVLIGSASKRIFGSLLTAEEKVLEAPKIVLRYLVVAGIVGFLIGLLF
tara:strand:- start:32699 stop:33064 length:366 start_codon:yes stop_codon:yes gene_type:complete